MYEYNGYTFRFKGDEDIKALYIRNYEYFKKMLGYDFPTSNITYIQAKGLANGKTLDKMNEILNVYESYNTGGDKKGMFHKYTLFDELANNNKSVNTYVRNYNKLIEKANYKNENENLNFNIVFYTELR